MASSRRLKAGSAFVEFFLDDGKLQRGLKTTEAKLRKFGGKLKNIGAGALTAGLAGLTAIALPFAKLAEFDDAIRAVGAVSMASAADLRGMEKVALELGRTTSFTAVQVASLMTELGRAGFNPAQINTMTDAVLNLSRATGTEAATSAGIMAASIRQFSLGAEDATRVANVLTVAANSTFNTVEGLGDSLAYAGPVAADLGMSLEDTVAILGTLGNVGIQGSSAGTAIRRLATLSAAEATKMQKTFGVAFVDAAGNARPLVDVLGDVGEATDSLPTAQRAKVFSEAFGLLGITAASAISKTAGSTKELAERLKNVTTEAADAAAAMDAGPGGMIRRLQSAFEGLQISIGKAVEKLVAGFGGSLTETIGKATAFIERNQALVIMVAKVSAGLVVLGGGLVSLGVAMQLAAVATGGFSTAISLASGLVGVLSSVSLAGFYKSMTVQVIPAMVAGATAANAMAVGMVAMKVAMGGAVLYAIYKVSSAIYAANGNLRDFNKSIKESQRLTGQLAKRQDKLQQKTLETASKLTGRDQLQFLKKKLEQAEKELAGKSASVKGQEKIVGGLDTAFNNATGNKVLEGERENLRDLEAQKLSLTDFVDQLRDSLDAAEESSKAAAAAPEANEVPKLKPDAPEVQKEAAKVAKEVVAEAGLTVDAATLKTAAELGAMTAFGATGGLAGIMGQVATNDDLAQAIDETAVATDDARKMGIEAVANSAVDFRSASGQEELAKALGGFQTEDQFEAATKKQTEAILKEMEKQTKQERDKPSLKVSKP